jgi:N-acetyl-anhydromuramyl-L-alanine amidase AmpD
MKPEYIVIHTAAFRGKNCDAKLIDEWHRARGWSQIGYHYVILNDRHEHKPDGLIEEGRPINLSGAHARGINSKSIGICCVGHGDYDDFTSAQYVSLIKIIKNLQQQFAIPTNNVIGHRELNLLVDKGLVSESYRTNKSCPGSMVDLTLLRKRVESKMDVTPNQDEKLKQALQLLKQSQHRFNQAQDELLEFIHHPEVIEILNG